ncbi:MAG: DUF116 domain-containing protein [Ignavibacteria bacterium]|jgi:hypothetical protein|nr:DUF116 domain-containing protein [Ignavibacteria bacterium]MCU7502840.1 DUF116 domain-containing protein [Ignavibacteria bacterium]MCU7515666.1 DUF116 domain-containing protein [Ignavibacteria bacterium]
METITYSLRCGSNNSQEYYQTVSRFTDEVLINTRDSLLPLVDEFKEYILKYKLEEVREDEEYILELISFGVLWHTYSRVALKVRVAPFVTLSHMADWRKKHQKVKPYIDIARGVLTTLFLLPGKSNSPMTSFPSLAQLDHVCKWFEATGEFKEQALRFIRWRAFWNTKSEDELKRTFLAIHNFTNWFRDKSLDSLGKYTVNVESFLRNSFNHYLWREDRISCTRSRLEYHLNMVGAELMNRAFRKEFLKTETKALLLPGCMRGRAAEDCKATKVPGGLHCEGCLAGCHVNQLREMGKKYNFEVYVIPHASDLSLWSPKEGFPSRGVVASACITTLVEGGWELKRYDVPAQCVILDFCGCNKHWHKEGLETELNVRQLKNILAHPGHSTPVL